MGFLKTPYLPAGQVLWAVGDIDIKGINMIKPYYNKLLPLSMARHADLSFCYLGEGIAVSAPEAFEYYSAETEDIGLKIIKGSLYVGRTYPFDAAYNVCIMKDKIFCKKSITDPVLLSTACDMGYEIININQGYAKCSVCPVDEKSAISADMSFYRAASKAGIEVLQITNGQIVLNGFDNGFFGGCAYMPAKAEMGIAGDIKSLPQCEKITAFLSERGITLKNGKGEVRDFGSFIPVIEE